MNVTVMVPPALHQAVGGRAQLELGVPATADVGDVLSTLITLYPKLAAALPSDRKAGHGHLGVVVQEHLGRDVIGTRPMEDGQRVFLFGAPG